MKVLIILFYFFILSVFSSATPVIATPSTKRKLPLESVHSFGFSSKKRRSVKKSLGFELLPNTLFSGTSTPGSGIDECLISCCAFYESYVYVYMFSFHMLQSTVLQGSWTLPKMPCHQQGNLEGNLLPLQGGRANGLATDMLSTGNIVFVS